MSIRVLLVDDYAMIRECLRSLLEKRTELEVVGEAEDGRSALKLVQELLPDIVIMDVTMPRLNGIETTRQITSKFPKTKVIAFSTSCKKSVTEMLAAGVLGYVSKECSIDELIKAIQAVTAGSRYLSPKVTKILSDEFVKCLSNTANLSPVLLTSMERKVLQLVAEGKSTKQISLVLQVSTKTIEVNRRQIMQKLNIQSIAELTKYAIREGFTPIE